jgi:hypothetical protein
MDMKPVKIGGELFWSNWMHQFNTKFNEDNKKYECTLGNISDKAAEALKELGIQIKHKPEMGNYIVGKSLYKFEPKDENGNPVPIEAIGNGTKVTALVSSYRHKMSAKFGAAPSIKMLIVTDLKTYNPEPKEAEEDDDIL